MIILWVVFIEFFILLAFFLLLKLFVILRSDEYLFDSINHHFLSAIRNDKTFKWLKESINSSNRRQNIPDVVTPSLVLVYLWRESENKHYLILFGISILAPQFCKVMIIVSSLFAIVDVVLGINDCLSIFKSSFHRHVVTP